MHESRLSALIIDCNVDDLAAASRFWAGALGREPVAPAPTGSPYIDLAERPGELTVVVQKVPHPSRVHLDLETDDVEAEVARLERLGARRVACVKDWWVLEAPTGQRFCVVPARKPIAGGNRWD
jgi:hypothetical protein